MIIFLILILIFNSTTPIVYANDTKTYFAKILFDEVYLYKTPSSNSDINNIYFELPKTYFVELLSKSGDFYEARYLGFKGYVKKDSVQAVKTTPSIPFLNNINFRVYADLSQTIRSSPTTQTSINNIVTTIPLLTSNITYLGQIKGECLIEGRTDIWYYCKYTSEKDYYGYVYSDFCDQMSTIIPNNEEVEFITNPSFETPKTQENTIPMNNNYVGIVIGILSIPALIFVFLIINGKHLLKTGNIKNKEVIDY